MRLGGGKGGRRSTRSGETPSIWFHGKSTHTGDERKSWQTGGREDRGGRRLGGCLVRPDLISKKRSEDEVLLRGEAARSEPRPPLTGRLGKQGGSKKEMPVTTSM